MIIWQGAPFIFPSAEKEALVEARYYLKTKEEKVQCQLCFRNCIIDKGERGYCGVRKNIEGILYTLVYGEAAGIQIDPIELEPIYHLLPGHRNLAIFTAGCNFRCNFCQNWHISTRTPEEIKSLDLSPRKVVELAIEKNCKSISFTINEPTIFYEYMLETAKLAQARGLKTLFHTNGAINTKPLKELLMYMDAVCVDLKAFTTEFYQITSFSELEPVLTTLKTIKESGVWFEITCLTIPTLNDDPEKIREMCRWIRDNLGKEVPVHFSRFFPAYKLTKLPPTPIETLEQARAIALEVGLEYVTIGNVPGHEANSTFCPQCGCILIERVHFSVLANHIEDGKCQFCGLQIPGIWKY
ncbi:MAG: Pyruvate formate-lyase 1-activating enzyme [candidate division WS2 bacterium]|nr:Pyruvate formate-lyase 1-activating enzyme [Candidatus Lithacetigena glycinireducens]